MKRIYNKTSLLVALIAFLSTVNAGETLCNIKFFETNEENWKNLASGWMLGLFKDPPYNSTTCNECWDFGNQIGLINYGVNYVESKRDEWIN